jgi:hypothetical protein
VSINPLFLIRLQESVMAGQRLKGPWNSGS